MLGYQEVPGLNFHQTPCIDDQMNVYSGSDQGTLLSFTRDGTKRWEKNFGTTGCQNPALYDDLLYTTCASGEVLALKMATGEKARPNIGVGIVTNGVPLWPLFLNIL